MLHIVSAVDAFVSFLCFFRRSLGLNSIDDDNKVCTFFTLAIVMEPGYVP